jgi:uncharacterized RDD family membrane protein YckC
MQCSSCRYIYSDDLLACPQCRDSVSRPETVLRVSENAKVTPTEKKTMMKADQAPSASTLIEFPGVPARPQWRKELSERVREIQERRARAGVLETGVTADRSPKPSPLASAAAPSAPLGLVPPAEAPEVNPIVAAALKRIERARQAAQPAAARRQHHTVPGGAATAAALARVAEPEIELSSKRSSSNAAAVPSQGENLPATQKNSAHKDNGHAAPAATNIVTEANNQKSVADNSQRAHKLVAIPAHPIAPKAESQKNAAQSSSVVTNVASSVSAVVATAAATASSASTQLSQPRRVINEVLDDGFLDRIEIEAASGGAILDSERPSAVSRVSAALIDLFVVAFAASPFAAIIVLMDGDWMDGRVSGSMLGFAVVVMFLYQTVATALAGRTWGMSLFSLYIVEAERGRAPSNGQAAGRAIIYILSLISFGIGILYALFDSHGRTAHDHLSGTVVVRE